MCMSIYAALRKAENEGKFDAERGHFKISEEEAEKSISGNLCRCTGYRPLTDVCKSFAEDVDLEDLGLNSYWTKKELPNRSKLPAYNSRSVCTLPDFLRRSDSASAVSSKLRLQSNGVSKDILLNASYKDLSSGLNHRWIKPASLESLLDFLQSLKGGSATDAPAEIVKLVVGNTSSGYYKDINPTVFVDIKSIPELNIIHRTASAVEVGAAVTITKLIDFLENEELNNNVSFGSNTFPVAPAPILKTIADHLKKVASVFIRNTGSVGGNLIMAQRLSFDSDIATLLLGVGASVKIVSACRSVSILTMDEFLTGPCLETGSLLLSIIIPDWNAEKVRNGPSSDVYLFKTYRAAPRPLGNALAYVNAGFLVKIALVGHSSQWKIETARLAFGAFGTAHAVRAGTVERFLTQKVINCAVLLEAIQLLKSCVVPSKDTRNAVYRKSVAVGFLFDFFLPFLNTAPFSLGLHNTTSEEKLQSSFKSSSDGNARGIQRLDARRAEYTPKGLVVGKQVMEIHDDYHPVGQPTRKVGAELQASGEAVYVDDIPPLQNCLYGAFVLSEKSLALIKKIDIRDTSDLPDTVSFISANDIPHRGRNVAIQTICGEEQLFAEKTVECIGQPIGLMVANTWHEAKVAANKVKVHYDTETLGPPILTVDDAIAKESFHQVPGWCSPKPVGDFQKGMMDADHKIESAEVKIGSQYYFYLETQTAIAIPDEDQCMTVYSSIQNPSVLQGTMAKCLGISENKIRIITRRVGGGFGGKAFRAKPVAVACALAAYKLKRPVRMYLDRKTDMLTTGGRHPVSAKYTVGFKNDGQITALHLELLIDAGFSVDVSPMMPTTIISALKKYDWGALSFDYKVCKTNLPSKSAMRGPGDAQGSFIAEAIIEHVASYIGMDANVIREKNLHTFKSAELFYGNAIEGPVGYTLPSIWETIKDSASIELRKQEIDIFNEGQKWRKKGLSLIPCIFEVQLNPKPARVTIFSDGSISVEVGGIELGQGLWTKVKQMTAFSFRKLEPIQSGDMLSKIEVIQSDTISLAHGGYTVGSTTSEESCAAVQQACNILVERLLTVKEGLERSKESVISWNELVLEAKGKMVDLSAQTYWIPDSKALHYANYGAAAAEVEVDLLTGSCMIHQVDIIYDCGRSLNPAVDLGQIEGAFIQGVGYFTSEEIVVDENGKLLSDGTWTYKIPTIDSIPKKINVEFFSSPVHQKRILSSKASGEPPLLLAPSVHCAIREAIREARRDHWKDDKHFSMDSPATMAVVKSLCGFENVECFLQGSISQ
eukprot:TRINITY_DN1571_c0_g1_i1.p1 TRINITY_DN1571_c0_g1~~TRINITY_DN1571_c0_g1_i1.p1  ORF type:complete len:1281 (+),score=269.60 TRINITY_DN1571_c0_g1_i1:1241-5083(+)